MIDRRRLLLILVSAVTAVSLASCATSLPSAPSSPATGPLASEAPGGEAPSGEITLYTSEPENKITEVIQAFNEDYPDVTVNLYRAATGELTARIASEQEAGGVRADVLLAADAPTFEKFKVQNLLAKFVPQDANNLLPSVVDPQGYYVGTRIIPTIIAYNTNMTLARPTSWKDLTDPIYRGKIAMPNPDVSGAAAFNTALWLDTPSLGEPWLKALVANDPSVLQSNGPVSQAIAEGQPPLGIVVDYLVRDLAAKGSPIGTIYPSEGVPYISQPAAVFESAANKPAAEAFVSFLISEKGQKLAVAQNYLPVREDVGTPGGAVPLSELTLLEPDIAAIAAKQDAAVKLFNSLLDG